jgi:hypothetical protein
LSLLSGQRQLLRRIHELLIVFGIVLAQNLAEQSLHDLSTVAEPPLGFELIDGGDQRFAEVEGDPLGFGFPLTHAPTLTSLRLSAHQAVHELLLGIDRLLVAIQQGLGHSLRRWR